MGEGGWARSMAINHKSAHATADGFFKHRIKDEKKNLLKHTILFTCDKAHPLLYYYICHGHRATQSPIPVLFNVLGHLKCPRQKHTHNSGVTASDCHGHSNHL